MHFSKKVGWPAPMLALLALGASACGSTSASPKAPSNHVNPSGVIEFAELPQSNLNWFLPLVNTGFDGVENFQLIYQLYKPLLWVNNNYTIKWKSSIARKITYNKAGTVYHVFLNPKWHWSNGDPVTSQDFSLPGTSLKPPQPPTPLRLGRMSVPEPETSPMALRASRPKAKTRSR